MSPHRGFFTVANKLGHYWELSYDIFDRIEVSVENRISYVNYVSQIYRMPIALLMVLL